MASLCIFGPAMAWNLDPCSWVVWQKQQKCQDFEFCVRYSDGYSDRYSYQVSNDVNDDIFGDGVVTVNLENHDVTCCIGLKGEKGFVKRIFNTVTIWTQWASE